MIIPKNIKEKMQKLIDNDYEVYIVGGAIRDYYFNKIPHDYDIFTNATGEQILKIFPNGIIIGGEERQQKILTIIVDDIEISQYRSNGNRTKTGDNLKQHQATCDFYINALAVDINGILCGDETIKRCGLDDIINKKLRFVGVPLDRIKEDKLRILRGIRFICKYGLKDQTILMDNLGLLHDLPKERISEELIKIFSIEQPWSDTSDLMFKILREFIPSLEYVKNMDGGDFHNELVDVHMKKALDYACKITTDWGLRLSIFLHDIGKGLTKTEEIIHSIDYDEEGYNEGQIDSHTKKEIHFYEHEKAGAEIVEKWMNKYKFSNDDIKYVITLIKLHMYSYKDNPNKKSYIKFFNKLEDAGIDIMDYIMMIYCDHQGNKAKPRIKFGDFVKNNWLHKKYYELKYENVPFKVHDLVLGGKDLIERYGMKPGPKIGEILKMIYDRIIDGDLKNDRAEIFFWLDNGSIIENEKRIINDKTNMILELIHQEAELCENTITNKYILTELHKQYND